MKKNLLILGGAGFIGSNIVKNFSELNYNITVIDGLLADTGGRIANIKKYLKKIRFYESKIENLDSLDQIVDNSDIIIDSMAWTLHKPAIKDPVYDLKLNCESHLHLLNKNLINKKIIYLGSRGQYGNPKVKKINENTPMIPEDIQGIHKLTTESYYRVYSNLNGFDVVSLRIPNCFGENQFTGEVGEGVIGYMLRNALADSKIEIFGDKRIKSIIYVGDLINYIKELVETDLKGFNYFNVNGYDIDMLELAEIITHHCGGGEIIRKPFPSEILKIDTGNAEFDDIKIRAIFPHIKKSDLGESIIKTINYYKERMN